MGNQNAKRVTQLEQLQLEIDSLKADNRDLRLELRGLLNRPRGGPEKSVVSPSVVNDFVETLLADPNVNMTLLPDAIERTLERKMLLALLTAVGHAVDSTSIELLGHQVTLSLQPKPANAPEN